MTDRQKDRFIAVICCIAIAVGTIVMLGWVFNMPGLKQIVPGFESMVFNMAFCFVLFGTSLLLILHRTKFKTIIFFILSLSCTLIGLISLFQFLFHFNSGLDQLFVKDNTKISSIHLFPGRMAYNAAVNVSLLGLGFLMLTVKNRVMNLIAQYLLHAVTILSTVALIGYMYGVSLFNSLFYVSSMAAHTAILFFILSIAASIYNSMMGVPYLLTGTRIGNLVAKRLFILMLIMVILFGLIRIQIQHYQQFNLNTSISLLAICFLLVSMIIIWSTASWLNRIDERRSAAEEEVKLMNAELEKRVKERSAEYQKSEEKYRSLIEQASDAIYMINIDGSFTDVNASMCKMMGYTRDELLQLNVRQIVDPEELKYDPLPTVIQNPDRSEFRERRFMRKDKHVFPVEINVKMFSGNMILVIARDITYRKKMETELRDAELKFRTMAEKSMVGVYIVKNGKFIYVNPRFAEVFGYAPEELTDTVPIETIIHESYRHITTENVRKRITGEVESVHYEAMGQKKDGTTNWVEFFGSRAIIDNEPTIIGSMIDITKRRKAEEELRSSEQKYKLLFDSNPLPLWMISKDDLSIIAANDAAASLYGYTKEELLHMNARTFRTAEDREKQLEGYKENLNTTTDSRTIRHIKKDGTVMVVQIIANDIILEGRSVRLSLTNDITEKLKAEESLQKSEANLQTILKSTDTAYALFDLDLKALAFNQKAIEFVEEQYQRTPQKGDSLADFFPAERFSQFLNFIKNVIAGKHISYEVDYLKNDGSTSWYDVRLSPITSDNHKETLGMLMAFYDITERKNAEQSLKSAYESIQDHINSIKEMAWKQSHLIRSPLANLKALSEMLKAYPGDAEVLKHFQAELNRLDNIIHEMAEEASGHDD
ncbi:PAS domain S-box protein [Mucilaginibacter sp. McL0603]|uniref:PAS domain S-box protein n=1 Tax=Mucilaginibacter sp. McL0603 TaxID=3415670 RepID=UPI003CF8B239